MILLDGASIQKFLDNKAMNGASAETIRAYRSDLNGALPSCVHCTDWDALEVALANYLNRERQRRAAKTVQRRLGTFRSFAKWARPGEAFLQDYKPPVAARPEPHPIPEGIPGVIKMIESSRNPRHRALIALQGLMGLRVGEAVSVKPDDFDLANMQLRVTGKGAKTRIVDITPDTWKYLEKAHALAITNGTTLLKLSNRGARASVTRHGRKALGGRHVASHDLRATFATASYERHHDLLAVADVLGHADPNTTRVYTGVSQAARRTAMELI